MSKSLERLLKRTFVAALGFSFAVLMGPIVAAQESELQSYDVELIVFRHLANDATPEHGSVESQFGEGMTMPGENDEASELDGPPALEPAAATATYPALSAAKFKLTAIEEALRRSRNYRPIAHVGWTQPGYPRHTARFLSIDSLVPASSGLTGQIALSRGRYLHLTLDLQYTNPEAAGDATTRQVLKHSRRMRSNERHYIDHPAFGVIAIVTPSSN